MLLWGAILASGQASAARVLAAAASGMMLWGLYFALGFRSFARGRHANGLGMLLTVALPLAAVGLYRLGLPQLASLLPTGGVYGAVTLTGVAWAAGAILVGLLALLAARRGLENCEAQLRRWYDQHHSQK
jgi:hypothetical protein